MELQANLTSAIQTNKSRNVALCLNPQFTYNKGQLWITEQMCMQTLSRRPTNMDKKFALYFTTGVIT